jgi:protein-disulfide isomerase
MFNDRIQKTEIAEDDWILGSEDVPITLLEYGDFECPYCAMARPVLEGLVAEFPTDIRLIFRHFPISTTHPHARIAAESAEAAGAQGKFWEMHDMLFTHQDRLEFEDLRRYAHAIGLDLRRFDQEMRDHVYEDEVRRDFRRGIRDGVNGTPSIFINGLRYDGPRDRRAILAAIQAQVPV